MEKTRTITLESKSYYILQRALSLYIDRLRQEANDVHLLSHFLNSFNHEEYERYYSEFYDCATDLLELCQECLDSLYIEEMSEKDE